MRRPGTDRSRAPAVDSLMTRRIGMPPATLASKPMGRLWVAASEEELVAVLGQKILVGGHNRLTLAQCGAQKLKRLARAAHGLDDHIDVGILNELRPIGDGRRAFRSVLGLNARASADGDYVQTDATALLDQ